MGQHYPKATVEVQAWCQVCHRETMHRVADGRLQACKDCLSKRDREHDERKPAPPQQGRLF